MNVDKMTLLVGGKGMETHPPVNLIDKEEIDQAFSRGLVDCGVDVDIFMDTLNVQIHGKCYAHIPKLRAEVEVLEPNAFYSLLDDIAGK